MGRLTKEKKDGNYPSLIKTKSSFPANLLMTLALLAAQQLLILPLQSDQQVIMQVSTVLCFESLLSMFQLRNRFKLGAVPLLIQQPF